jgi:hypothetical protein
VPTADAEAIAGGDPGTPQNPHSDFTDGSYDDGCTWNNHAGFQVRIDVGAPHSRADWDASLTDSRWRPLRGVGAAAVIATAPAPGGGVTDEIYYIKGRYEVDLNASTPGDRRGQVLKAANDTVSRLPA